MRTLASILTVVFLASIAWADDAVVGIQARLKQLGYYDGTVDGQMGSQTAAAIRRFQIAEKLKVTGQLDQKTLKRLGVSGKPAPVSATTTVAKPAPQAPAPETKRRTVIFPSGRIPPPEPEAVRLSDLFRGGPFITLSPEMQIAVIKQAQRNLRLLGYYRGPLDGSASTSFVSALRTWQRAAGFRPNGRLDETTLKGLSLMPD